MLENGIINMKIIYNKIIPWQGFKAINLFGILFVRSKLLKEKDINHEAIHSEQMKELLWIPFYIWYLIEFMIKLWIFLDGSKAYKSISFEKEAYKYENDLTYLDHRKRYNWIKYVFKK